MKTLHIFLLSTILASIGLSLAGCNDETVADPKLTESMNKQREAMQPRPDGSTPPPPAASESK